MYKKPCISTLKLGNVDNSISEECLIMRDGLERKLDAQLNKFKYALESPKLYKRQSSSGRNSHSKLTNFDFLNQTQNIRPSHKKTKSIVLNYFKLSNQDKIDHNKSVNQSLYGFSKLSYKIK